MGMEIPFVPKYQDLTFKTDFKLNDKNSLSVIGIWGASNIDFDIDEGMLEFLDMSDFEATFFQQIEVNSLSYILGGTHKVKFSPKTELKNTVSFVRSDTRMLVDTMNRYDGSGWQIVWHENAIENKYSAYSELTHRFSYHSRIIGGLKYDLYDFNYLEKADKTYSNGIVTDENGEFNLLRAYAQYVHNLSSGFSITGGFLACIRPLTTDIVSNLEEELNIRHRKIIPLPYRVDYIAKCNHVRSILSKHQLQTELNIQTKISTFPEVHN